MDSRELKRHAFSGKDIEFYLKKLNDAWYMADGKKLRRKFKLVDFGENMRFVNKIAGMAEEEAHYAEMCIICDILEVTLWTHDLAGLTEIDFIMATRIDGIYDEMKPLQVF
jgi:4a-hydroxytetrahydrobiopterin dehydratase